MARRVEEKQRKISNDRVRKQLNPKYTILIGIEGKNKTENLYFHNYRKNNKSYTIRIASGNFTDPMNMVKAMILNMKKWGINPLDGDLAYCIFDTDEDYKKDIQIEQALKLANDNGIEIITSNPCFENWFLCHFRYSTKQLTNKSVITELNKYIKNYQKNQDVYPILEELTSEAIKNAKKQCEYQEKIGKEINKVEANPSTQVYKIVEELLK